MKTPLFMLHSDWITEKHIDFEYQSYLLLGYLKAVDDSFNKSKLYPYLPELIGHHQNLLQLKNEKKMLAENSRNRISEKYTLEIRKRNLLELISRL